MITDKKIAEYAETHTSPQSDKLSEIVEYCYSSRVDRSMLSGFYQGRLLSFFSKMIRPKNILEIGTYLGFSAICLAEGLADDGKLISFDISIETQPIAAKNIAESPFADKIELITGDAKEKLKEIDGQFDLVFIDADKVGYPDYYDLVIDRVVSGGFIIADNVFFGGNVLNADTNENGRGVQIFNEKVKNDERVENLLLTVRDGLMLIRKK